MTDNVALYFPHTYIAADTARLLSPVFGPVTILMPTDLDSPALGALKTLERDGALKLAFPPGDAAKKAALKGALRDSRNAVSQGLTSDAALAEALAGRVPYTDETSPSMIRREILAGDHPAPGLDLSAEIFLCAARDLDFSQYEAALALAAVREKEAALFSRLEGEPGAQIPWRPPVGVPLEAVNYRVPARLRFWSRLFLRAPLSAAIFVTPSLEAWELVQESHADAVRGVWDFSLPAFPGGDETRAIRALVGDLAEKGETDACAPDVPALSGPGAPPERILAARLSISLVEKSPAAVFAAFAGVPVPEGPGFPPRTVACLVSF